MPPFRPINIALVGPRQGSSVVENEGLEGERRQGTLLKTVAVSWAQSILKVVSSEGRFNTPTEFPHRALDRTPFASCVTLCLDKSPALLSTNRRGVYQRILQNICGSEEVEVTSAKIGEGGHRGWTELTAAESLQNGSAGVTMS
uniref:Uncharacterized protein n=1 Tax=Vespula pensylvanica TaxID=30213 RepID=A0A834NQL2_VESPE|nr:hypothetical protein H0235_012282 [Vespula pensylvanica]